MKEIQRNEELISYFDNQNFVALVFAQLAKEFEKVGVAFSLSDEEVSSFPKFQSKLATELDLIAQQSSARFSQLLYVIDLPDTKVLPLFKNTENPLKELAALILQRIAQKVYFREKYR